MNNFKNFQSFITETNLETLVSNLSDLLYSLDGESLNDMIALILSEILAPGSQNGLQSNLNNSWLTPLNKIGDATKIGECVSQAIVDTANNKINWNRVFNLMSTKYFLNNKKVKLSNASLSSVFSILRSGALIDEFLECDWDLNCKLDIAYLLHKWSISEGCFNLLGLEDMKPVITTTNDLPNDLDLNQKMSLLYFKSIASLNLEIFLLRDEMAENEQLPLYQDFFFQDYNNVPEFLALALILDYKKFVLLTENKATIDELLVTLALQVYEKNQVFMKSLIKKLNTIDNNSEKLVEITSSIANNDKLLISNFINILNEENKLNFIINKMEVGESIKILSAATQVGWKGFDEYIDKNLNINSVAGVLDYLEKICSMNDNNTLDRKSRVFDISSLHKIITKLMNLPMNPQERQMFEKIQLSIIIVFPRIINFGYGNDDAILKNGDLVPIPAEVETEMQSYLQQMYSNELSIKDIIDLLRKLRDSDNSRDQDLFTCMTHAVLAESTFFKDYPLDALATTSVLFGSIILFQLLRGFVLDVAFKVILNFAKEGPESKMFKFAIQAIYAFKMRLVDYPQYCKDLITQIPGLQTQPQVYQAVAEAAALLDQRAATTGPNQKHQVEYIPIKYFFVEELVTGIPQENPSKDTIEKILFLVNNMTEENFDSKIDNIKSLLQPAYSSWFSHYLVTQRAITEPNYHSLYSKIITFIDSDVLYEYMLNTTLKQLLLLISTKEVSSIDKNALKSLSSWLGRITLGVDKPIRHKNIAIRELLLDAHKNNRLEIIVPFVCKIIANVIDSKIFAPPNAWTMGILMLLAELNKKANWKLSLTFEVEVLFKLLSISLAEIEESHYLENIDIVEELAGSLNNVSVEQRHIEQQRQMATIQQYQHHNVSIQNRQSSIPHNNLQGEQQSQSEVGTSNDELFSNLVGSTLFVTHPDLRRVFRMAIAKSVREILPPAIEKSASIAVVTTTRIVSKDFATEVDDSKFKAAAITMVRQLAQSLARTTSIELLKDDIRTTTQSLAPNLTSLIAQPMEELQKAIDENVGIALVIIENAAMDRAMQEIGEHLMQEIAIRHYHKDRRSDQPFLSPNANPYALGLPEPLGLKTAGVTPQQFRIYENFGKFKINNDNVSIPPGAPVGINNQQRNMPQQNLNINQQQQQQPQIFQNYAAGMQPQVNGQIPGDIEQVHRVLVQLMDSLVIQIKENSNKSGLKDLEEQNPIKQIILQILSFIDNSLQRDQLALKVAQAVVNSLFATSDSPLCREVLSIFLEQLCSLSALAKKDVIWWLIYAPDSRKFNTLVINSLLHVNLIIGSDVDTMLSVAINNKIENAVMFTIKLLQENILSDVSIMMRMDFVKTVKALSLINDENVRSFLDEYKSRRIIPIGPEVKISETEKYHAIFTEWVKLLEEVEPNDEITVVFITQLLKKGVLSNTADLTKMMKASLELSISIFKESDPTGEVFVSIDALTKLIICLITYQVFETISISEFIHIIFSVIILVFTKDHEQTGSTFNERPYFRLFSNMLSEWSKLRGHNFVNINDAKIRNEFIKFDSEFYEIFSTYLLALQPLAYPGFSFAFITLLSHRMFLPVMLRLPENKGWENLTLLIIALFKFLDQYTEKEGISNAISVVYKGTLRVMLGISNDQPEYLIENHYELLSHLTASYVQLKNVILSAVPKKMFIPNPYNPQLEMKDIEDCQKNPSVFYDPVLDLHVFKKPVDNYLRIPSNSLFKTILNAVHKKEYVMKNGVGYDYVAVDTKLVRAIVLHIGVEVGIDNEKTSSNVIFNTKSSYYTLLFDLINEGSVELKSQLTEAIVEQLRYPNIHTYWFSYVLKQFFYSQDWGEKTSEIQEIILRNLLERIIVNKPHPWGVTVLFTELLHNKDTKLIDLNCVKSVPEIEKIIKILSQTSGNMKVDAVENTIQAPPIPIL
ncbi:hypothetical protein TPHA_0H02420 [Tetrapisispora phaffii CBS 4417]|uniref:General negative regulator of transcription subunit 1 n=1 Tax=Tetrapisispora phaffii (strain ATCC 24235 / CBS 4417 / NBRC 1672 / NRRL Y-8282 / UCD 70-5) TaxID=1071381 RepID=G8BWJ4_TETPH|nr:hypothetical protein TPHA_0H02420 [Tetrapisispora phaffii CBS 4417]CCE64445.1 hypothetical protein TPHA_0H02420 [Tetrapisispora phaffii CBS 4417]